MPKQIRVSGHTLPFEGRIRSYHGLGSGPGPARCSCGWESGNCENTSQRQRAHRQHKLEVMGASRSKPGG